MDAARRTDERGSAPAQAYRPPVLVVYGSVAARTLSVVAGSIADAMAGMAMM